MAMMILWILAGILAPPVLIIENASPALILGWASFLFWSCGITAQSYIYAMGPKSSRLRSMLELLLRWVLYSCVCFFCWFLLVWLFEADWCPYWVVAVFGGAAPSVLIAIGFLPQIVLSIRIKSAKGHFMFCIKFSHFPIYFFLDTAVSLWLVLLDMFGSLFGCISLYFSVDATLRSFAPLAVIFFFDLLLLAIKIVFSCCYTVNAVDPDDKAVDPLESSTLALQTLHVNEDVQDR
jgi:hypothetical protein